LAGHSVQNEQKLNRNIQVNVKPEVLRAIKIKVAVYYDVFPCRLVAKYQGFKSSTFLENTGTNLTHYMTLLFDICLNQDYCLLDSSLSSDKCPIVISEC
jgi:hypothetical protein